MVEETDAKILMIDDDENFCLVTANLLRLGGCRVEYRSEIPQAMEYLDSFPDVDVVLLDIDLSADISGVELLPQILEQHQFVQVIMLTSQRTLETGIQCMKNGAYDYLNKPFKREEFFRILPGALERKKIMQLNSLYLEILVHDLKNPLQSLNMALDILTADPPPAGALKEKSVNLARFGSDQINSMISNILNISKLEKASFPFEYTEFQPEEVMENEIKGLIDRIHFSNKKLTLDLKLKKKYIIKTDRGLFCQILSNLLANAIRFAKQNITIIMEKGKNNQFITKVINTGSFIEEAQRDAVFDKFFKSRFQSSGGGKNFGLGLTFCKMAVEALGGKIYVESDESIPETTFTFIIPEKI